ncbi:hypothetical protein EV421DRAFT_2018339 [Armillaria borealis]|uniref:Uncharacterized protein n=1 Tax=Armillaria borealis TaxID=47425 RepID=A0AA39JPH0_9AGAR|nr:hypothetical protein EV421DRAFT_2018339 [Armillaria borealis]
MKRKYGGRRLVQAKEWRKYSFRCREEGKKGVGNADATLSTSRGSSMQYFRIIKPCLRTRLLPFLVRSRHLSTRTALEKELFELRDSLYTLQELVEHPKAADYLRAVHAYHYEDLPESSSKERWIEVCRRLKMPESYKDPNELIYGLSDYSPPQMYLPQSFHVETYKATWKFLNSFSSPFEKFRLQGEMGDIGLVVPGLVATTSLFYNHARIIRNKSIPKCHQGSDPLPLGEPVSYQVVKDDYLLQR